jgi:multicomponent Na+:H+ antiporter subunit D
MNSLGGMSSRMPVTTVTSVVSWLSAAGIPPLAGFWSKLLIVVALWGSGRQVYALVAIAASVLTLAYFLFMQRQVFQGNLKEEFSRVTEAAPAIIIPVSVLAAISVGLGLVFPLCMKFLKF